MIIDLDEHNLTYDKLISYAKSLAEKHHRIIQYVTIGSSHDNRDIAMLKLGRGKKYLLFSAGVHGRETINPVVLLKLTQYYAEHYYFYTEYREKQQNDMAEYDKEEHEKLMFCRCIHELLQTFTLLIIPLLNPDGYMISLYGYDTIRDSQLRQRAIIREIPYQVWKYNGRGVDVNRNFPSRLWKPKGSGDYAASENETKTLIAVFHHYRIRGYIDLHSRGKVIYYYRSRMPELYNERQYRIAKRLKDITKYELMPPGEEIEPGDSGGNTVHYFSEHFLKPALTLETVDEDAQFPLDTHFCFTTFEELKLLFFEFGSLMIT